MASSLEHLATNHVDSFVLHGPASGYGWSDYDVEVWGAMLAERDAGRTRLVGVSNVSLLHLRQLAASGAPMPAFVQNRCFARRGRELSQMERSEEHTSELQSHLNIVCRLLLEK